MEYRHDMTIPRKSAKLHLSQKLSKFKTPFKPKKYVAEAFYFYKLR